MGHHQPQPCSTGCCDSGCPEHDNLPPTVICRIDGTGDDLTFSYAITRADFATLTVSCPDEEPTVTDLTDLLVGGRLELTTIPYDPTCIYTVRARNDCSTVFCATDCDDITLTVDSNIIVNEDPTPCGSTLWEISWSYLVAGLNDRMRFGRIVLYHEGNPYETIFLPSGMFSDSGVLMLDPCEFPSLHAEFVYFYVETECGRFAETWLPIPTCDWLVGQLEAVVSGVEDLDINCNYTGPDYNGGFFILQSREITYNTTGLAQANGTYLIDMQCGSNQRIEEQEIDLGAFEYEFIDETVSRANSPGSQFSRETRTTNFVGTFHLYFPGCTQATLDIPDFTPDNPAFRFRFKGTLTENRLLVRVSDGFVFQNITTVTECTDSAQSFQPFANLGVGKCPAFLRDNAGGEGEGDTGLCNIPESQPDRPILTTTLLGEFGLDGDLVFEDRKINISSIDFLDDDSLPCALHLLLSRSARTFVNAYKARRIERA